MDGGILHRQSSSNTCGVLRTSTFILGAENMGNFSEVISLYTLLDIDALGLPNESRKPNGFFTPHE